MTEGSVTSRTMQRVREEWEKPLRDEITRLRAELWAISKNRPEDVNVTKKTIAAFATDALAQGDDLL